MEQEELPLGYSTELRCNDLISAFQEKTEAHFIWLQEILAEAKKSFASPEIVLLPKTPSCRRTRRGRATAKAIAEDDEDELPPKKRTRKGKKTRVEELRGSLETVDSDSSVTSSTSHDVDMSADESDIASADSKRSTRSTRTTTSSRATRAKSTRSTRSKKDQQEEPMETSPTKSLKFEENPTIPEMNEDLSSEEDTKNSSTPTRDDIRQLNSPTQKESPKIIPGFGSLNVKAKVQAYEELNDSLNSSLKECKTVKSKGTPSSPRVQKPRSPRMCHSAKAATPSRKDTENVFKKSQATLNISSGANKTPDTRGTARSCRVVSDRDTPNKKRTSESRRSSVRGSLSNIRKSLSRRRSSILREKLTKSTTKQDVTDSPSVSKARSKTRKVKAALGGADMSSSDETSGSTPEKPKRTRSKMRTNKAPPPALPVEGSDTEEGPKSTESESEVGTFKTPEPVRKNTRSKLRKAKEPQKLESTDSEADTPSSKSGDTPIAGTPQREVKKQSRSKERRPRGTPQTDEEGVKPTPKAQAFKVPAAAPSTMAPCRSTRSKMRKWQEQVSQSPSSFSKKRPKNSADSEEETPRKKSCPGSSGSMSASTDSSGEVQRSGPRILKPGERSALQAACPSEKIIRPGAHSFLNNMKKTTPSNINTTAISFIQRHTPQKGITVQEKLQQQRQKLVAKDKQAEDRLIKRQELLAKKAEEAKRKREEKLKAVAKRREEQAKREEEARKGMEQKDKEAKSLAAKLQEDKIREEKEKQKLREKKIVEAEQRRKQEEELRQQRLKEIEEEKKQQEEFMRRKQEFEEIERKKRLEEERRLEEEKRAQAERERQKEMERIRKEEERRQREQEERARQEEERRKRERAERERQALERQKEIERQKQEELKRQQEKERQRLREESERKAREEAARKAEEAARRAAEAKAKEEREKHTLQQNSSLNSSYTIPAGQAKLNTSTTKKLHNIDSYDMTPMRVYKTTSPNPDNYGIEDLKSDDDTDDEDQPRKRIPAWAQGANLKVALINQYYHPPNLDDLFEIIEMPDLRVMFKKQKPRFNKRTSSAIWDSPIMKHSGLP